MTPLQRVDADKTEVGQFNSTAYVSRNLARQLAQELTAALAQNEKLRQCLQKYLGTGIADDTEAISLLMEAI